jgi:hypothetical protein
MLTWLAPVDLRTRWTKSAISRDEVRTESKLA